MSNSEKVSAAMVSLMTEMTTYYFQRLFKSVIGVSPKEFHADCKQKLFRQKLKNGENVLSANDGSNQTRCLFRTV